MRPRKPVNKYYSLLQPKTKKKKISIDYSIENQKSKYKKFLLTTQYKTKSTTKSKSKLNDMQFNIRRNKYVPLYNQHNPGSTRKIKKNSYTDLKRLQTNLNKTRFKNTCRIQSNNSLHKKAEGFRVSSSGQIMNPMLKFCIKTRILEYNMYQIYIDLDIEHQQNENEKKKPIDFTEKTSSVQKSLLSESKQVDSHFKTNQT